MNILVIGNAKTGTTGISKNIENSLENTEYFLEPKNVNFIVKASSRANEGKSNIVKILFEHWNRVPNLRLGLLMNEIDLMPFDKKVFIIRDPRDNLISRLFYGIHPLIRNNRNLDMNRVDQWIAYVRKKERYPQTISFLDLCAKYNELFNIDVLNTTNQHRKYFEFIREFATVSGSYVLRYEDFIDRNLEDMEAYLGFKLSNNTDVGENLQRTVRSKGYNNWKKLFLERDLDTMKALFDEELMAQYGYTDWEIDSASSLNPEEGSLYIERLIKDAKEKNTLDSIVQNGGQEIQKQAEGFALFKRLRLKW